MFKVYLAGPISGLTYDEAESWRTKVRGRLPSAVRWYSPLRNQQQFRDVGSLSPTTYNNESPLASKHGIMSRDAWDVKTSDLVFCNLLGAKSVSIGTVMELGMAYAWQKPVVLVMEPNNVHEHVMIDHAWSFRTDNIEAGIQLVADILLP